MSARAVVLTAVAVTDAAMRTDRNPASAANSSPISMKATSPYRRYASGHELDAVGGHAQQQLESKLKAKFPEIERVFARTGTAEIASDPMPPNISDGYIMLKPLEGLA